MNTNHYDVVIVGGGMVGLTLAAVLGQRQFRVALIEAKPPILTWKDELTTERVSALNHASVTLLKKIGVYFSLNPQTCGSLQKLMAWDSLGGGQVEFDAAWLGLPELGIIVENREIIRVLWQYLREQPNVELFIHQPQALKQTAENIQLFLMDKTITTELIVGADGANSWLQQQMQIKVKQRSYHQHAIVALIETEKKHQQTGWQNFLSSGPLGVLPLCHPHHCSMIWSVEDAKAKRLMALSETEFNCELSNALDHTLGFMKLIDKRISFPLTMRHVQQYVMPHLALVGDAAHTLHPLAGQGANLGFMDVICLVECLCDARHKSQALGSLKPLRRYERWRKSDNQFMLNIMRAFCEVFATEKAGIVQLRSLGFNLTDRLTWLKQKMMRHAVGLYSIRT